MVECAWGSKSTNRTFLPSMVMQQAMLAAVKREPEMAQVVLLA
jgi:hypothetical protein